MRYHYKHSRKNALFSEEIRQFLQKRALEAMGLCLMISGVSGLLSLIFYDGCDSSWNSLGSSVTNNLMGETGALYADLTLQLIGQASYVAPLILTVWGGHYLIHRQISHLNMRLAVLVPLLMGLSAWFQCFAFREGPDTGIPAGGIVGYVIHNRFYAWMGHSVILKTLLCQIIGIASWGAFFLVLGLPKSFYATAIKSLINGFKKLRAASEKTSVKTVVTPPLLDPSNGLSEPSLIPPSVPSPFIPESFVSEKIDSSMTKKDTPRESMTRSEKFPEPSRASSSYAPPSLDLLSMEKEHHGPTVSQKVLQEQSAQLMGVLNDFGVQGVITNAYPGPVITLFEFKPAPGVKASRVESLSDDIARSMGALSARIAVIPGYNALGIELPNPSRQIVSLRSLLNDPAYVNTTAKLPLVLGRNISGAPMIEDLGKMPHCLVAGTTGSGKSVSINTMILSLLYKLSPDECKFIMIDPKMLELSVYDGIPHLLSPVVTNPHKAVLALKWAVREMENRYQAMAKLGVRNIEGYNDRMTVALHKKETLSRRVQTGFHPETGQPIYEDQPIDMKVLPFIVVIVDEMADLMLVAGKEIEGAVQRLAQMARAAGIHLIMATQRPSVDVITGTIKANFPSRISFHVTSKIDSRTILSEQGAEQLLGQGDMLYMKTGGRIIRVHGPFVRDQEVEDIVKYLKSQGEPVYEESVIAEENAHFGGYMASNDDGSDALYNEALAIVRQEGKASTSFIQRHLQIGYNRAARIMEQMEAEGVVSKPNHVGKRDVLVSS